VVGQTRECTVFVLRGRCDLTSGDTAALLEGDVVVIGAGTYRLEVPATEGVEIVTVWDLRPHMD
jgi:quercetin dioxygenase-like cupin family protein